MKTETHPDKFKSIDQVFIIGEGWIACRDLPSAQAARKRHPNAQAFHFPDHGDYTVEEIFPAPSVPSV